MNKKRKAFIALSLISFIAFLGVGTVLLWNLFAQFKGDPVAFKAYIESFGMRGRLVFVGIQVAQIVFALIPGEAVELGAGYIFGAWQGFLLCEVGVALASIPIFLLVRTFGRSALHVLVKPEKIESMKFLQHEKRLEIIVFLLFLIPGTPKDVFTYFVGLTKINPWFFVATTLVARIPSILSSTWVGAKLGEQNYALAALIFAVVLVISGAGYLLYTRISRTKADSC